jgi:hypothetical protein
LYEPLNLNTAGADNYHTSRRNRQSLREWVVKDLIRGVLGITLALLAVYLVYHMLLWGFEQQLGVPLLRIASPCAYNGNFRGQLPSGMTGTGPAVRALAASVSLQKLDYTLELFPHFWVQLVREREINEAGVWVFSICGLKSHYKRLRLLIRRTTAARSL